MKNYLAIDLGAESGRIIVGTIDQGRLQLTETYRFSNGPVQRADGLHWDVYHLWDEIQAGMARSAVSYVIESVAIDAWGVDFALMDAQGQLIELPFHYRDGRTDGMLAKVFSWVPQNEIFSQTGIQFMQINTLYQLLAMKLANSPALAKAQTLLLIPDLFNYWMSGVQCSEFTDATTTQCYDPEQRDWAYPLLEKLGLPIGIFPPVCAPGTILGLLNPEVAQKTGLGPARVVAPACHDTGSAVVAVPAEGQDFVWLSSGTWSIMGCETPEPNLSQRALDFNLTNEGGVFDTWRLSKNIMGLWLLQECKREWGLSYDEIMATIPDTEPFMAVIDLDAPAFLHPGGMEAKIRQFCERSGQAVPQSQGEVARVILESLALKYRFVLERLETLIGKRLAPIHIIGGGTKNRFLNQFTADSTGREVITGPAEATAIGNILMQAIALGDLEDLRAARMVVRASFSPEKYVPRPDSRWDAAYDTLLALMAQ